VKSITTGTQPYGIVLATSSANATPYQFGPNEWAVFAISGVDNVTTNGPTGRCSAVWKLL
jgi:hypothetical protein